jgi:hypothetical protein
MPPRSQIRRKRIQESDPQRHFDRPHFRQGLSRHLGSHQPGDPEENGSPMLMLELNKVTVKDYLPINSIVIKNVLATGADIITTAPMKKGN